jgi:hypothetical protein
MIDYPQGGRCVIQLTRIRSSADEIFSMLNQSAPIARISTVINIHERARWKALYRS